MRIQVCVHIMSNNTLFGLPGSNKCSGICICRNGSKCTLCSLSYIVYSLLCSCAFSADEPQPQCKTHCTHAYTFAFARHKLWIVLTVCSVHYHNKAFLSNRVVHIHRSYDLARSWLDYRWQGKVDWSRNRISYM